MNPLRILLAVFPAALFPGPSAFADIQAEMSAMFDSLGAYGNVTAPRMISGETRNVATFGGLYYRAPRRSYSVATFTPPSFRAGCGGIDLYAGAFSFINKEQFVQYLRSVAANSVGLAFKMALSSLSPELAKTLEDLQKSTEALNRFNLDSCEAAQALVRGDIGTAMLGGQSACRSLGPFLNTFSDGAEARLMCAADAEAQSVGAAAAADPDAGKAAPIELTDGNLMWRILGEVAGIDDSVREILMSATGTYVASPSAAPGNGSDIRYVPPTIDSGKQLVADQAVLITCPDSDCLNPSIGPASLTGSFRALVAGRLGAITAKMRDGTGTLTSAEESFLTANSLPVLQIIQTDAAGSVGLADMATDAIALGAAHAFLAEALRIARTAAAAYRTRSATEAQMLERLVGNAADMQRSIFLEFNAEVGRLGEVLDLRRSIVGLRAALWQGRFKENLRRVRDAAQPGVAD